jgi:hypothetical protein
METVMFTIGIALIFVLIVGIVFFEPSYMNNKAESKDYFVIKFNPKKDITAYELATLHKMAEACLCGRTFKICRDTGLNVAGWNNIPILMQRHFDIVKDTRND